MKRIFLLLATSFSIAVSALAQTQSSSMLNTIRSFYESDYQGSLPCTNRFMLYDKYTTDFDVFSMSQDPDTPANVKVIACTDRKNAYDVTFYAWGEKKEIIIQCINDGGKMKVDNVIIPSISNDFLFKYSDHFEFCYGFEAYEVADLLNDFIWSINGGKEILSFEVSENGEVKGIGYISGSTTPSVRTYKGTAKYKGPALEDPVGDSYCSVKEYVLGTYNRSFKIHPDENDENLIMESNGKSYIMTLVEPIIR